ncbi:MAG TPA: hypothetical protein VLA48_02920 [Nitrososphaeraceae archaeon]|nr:hypothetical protein [Nitrososphaeraceae archaeon]
MNAKEYNKLKENLYKKAGLEKTDLSHEVMIQIPFGVIYISSEWSPRIKVANIHSKLVGDIKAFKNETGYNINEYNGKLNSYYNSPIDCFDELEEFINNLLFLAGKEVKTVKN